MKYLRIYADEQGESHFEEIEVGDRVSTDRDLSDQIPATGVLFRMSPAGRVSDWHNAPRRQFVITLSGEGEVEASDGEVRKISPGMVLLADDLTGKGHITRTIGDQPRLTAFAPLTDQAGKEAP